MDIFDQVAGSQPPSLHSNFKPHCYRGVIQCHLIRMRYEKLRTSSPCTPTIHLQTLSGIGIQPSHGHTPTDLDFVLLLLHQNSLFHPDATLAIR